MLVSGLGPLATNGAGRDAEEGRCGGGEARRARICPKVGRIFLPNSL